jgi:hypothetical protein
MSNVRDIAQEWRDRAEELRLIASRTMEPQRASLLLESAASLDRAAARLEAAATPRTVHRAMALSGD